MRWDGTAGREIGLQLRALVDVEVADVSNLGNVDNWWGSSTL